MTVVEDFAVDHPEHENQSVAVDGIDLRAIAEELKPRWQLLRQFAEMFFDHQQSRVAAGNRLGSEQVALAVGGYETYIDYLKAGERALSRKLVKTYRDTAPPGLVAWAQATPGVGVSEPHMLARFLGHLGHPRLAIPREWVTNPEVGEDEFGTKENPKRLLVDGEPFLRTFSQLREYCGHGSHNQRYKGMSQEEALALGRPECKSLLRQIALNVVKAQVRSGKDGAPSTAIGPLGQFYLNEKARYAQRTHTEDCSGGLVSVKIGGRTKVIRVYCKRDDGERAQVGDPFGAAHIKSIGERHLGKQVLREIFDASHEPWCS